MISQENYINGDQHLEIPAHLNFGKYILQKCIIYSDCTALINAQTGKKWTYRELGKFAINLSVPLAKLGVEKGDVVAVCSETRDEILATIVAIISAGAIYTPIDISCGKAVLLHKLNITKPKYVICSNEFWSKYNDTLNTLDFVKNFITFDNLPDFEITIKNLITENVDMKRFEPKTVQGQIDTAIILYSSGTTGMPKGVMLTHLTSIIASTPDFCFSNKNIMRYLSAGLWSHNYDLFTSFKCLVAGKVIIYEPIYDYVRLIEDIGKYKVDMLLTTPDHVAFISKMSNIEKYDMSTLKLIYSRTFSLHAKVINIVKERLPNLVSILQGYGMTESGEPASESRGPKGPKMGSVGVASPTITIKVVDVNTRQALGIHEQGEICLKGPCLMKGYIGVDIEDYLDDEGFFKTGDLGYYDKDNYFFIVGRLKEIIMYLGYQNPNVQDVGVIGIPDTELEDNKLPMAFVVKKEGSAVTEEDLVDYVASEVSDYMKLRGGVRFISQIPRNSRGKILRSELLTIFLQSTKTQ